MPITFKAKSGDLIHVTSDGENIRVESETQGQSRNYQIGRPGILEDFEVMEIESVEQVINAYKTGKVYFE